MSFCPRMIALLILALPTAVSAEELFFDFRGANAGAFLDFAAVDSDATSPVLRVTPNRSTPGTQSAIVKSRPSGLGVDTQIPDSDAFPDLLDNADGSNEYLDFTLVSLGDYACVRLTQIVFAEIEHAQKYDDDIFIELPSAAGFHYDPSSGGVVPLDLPSGHHFALNDFRGSHLWMSRRETTNLRSCR